LIAAGALGGPAVMFAISWHATSDVDLIWFWGLLGLIALVIASLVVLFLET